jgi:ubiquinone/menaquinone biosynthesis C-methylase UbiE
MPAIRERVREVFNRVAESPLAKFRFAVGPALATRLGYPMQRIAALPPTAADSFTGVAYLHDDLDARGGDHLLDLGSGGGLDTLLMAQSVLPGGTVTGLDIAERMVEKAANLALEVGVKHASFRQGSAEVMPFADATFDAAHVNGFFNLCPDKAAVARELLRVLKVGGRAVVAEITFAPPMERPPMNSPDDWFR